MNAPDPAAARIAARRAARRLRPVTAPRVIPPDLRAPDAAWRLARLRASFAPLHTLAEQLQQTAYAGGGADPVTHTDLLNLTDALHDVVVQIGRDLYGQEPPQ